MRGLIIGLLAFAATSAFAESDKNLTLEETLATQSCKVTVVNRPIDFEKHSNIAQVGQVYIKAFNIDLEKVRRLKIGRSFNVFKLDFRRVELLMKDPSIYNFCVDYSDGNTGCDTISKLTIAEIEHYSDSNLEISCILDELIIF
jgi:hypothetical protein